MPLPGSNVQRFIIASDSYFMFSCFKFSCCVSVVLFNVLLFCLVWCFVLVFLFSASPISVMCFAVNNDL